MFHSLKRFRRKERPLTLLSKCANGYKFGNVEAWGKQQKRIIIDRHVPGCDMVVIRMRRDKKPKINLKPSERFSLVDDFESFSEIDPSKIFMITL